MPEGAWLVTTGDAIGIASGILAMSRRLSLNDWLAFCERCGQPGLHAKTDAQYGSKEWHNVERVVKAFGRNWAAVTGRDTEMSTLSLNTSAAPWPALVEMCSRSIAALWRGSDLATMSRDGSAVGSNAQQSEKNILEEDFCEAISETLHDQVSRHVIQWKYGDNVEPLAYLQIRPTTAPNTDMDIKVDQHLVSLGVPLSRNDALARYGRTAHNSEDDSDAPLSAPSGSGLGGLGGEDARPNERSPRNPVAKRRNPVAFLFCDDGRANAAPHSDPPLKTHPGAFLAARAFWRDMSPFAESVAKILELPENEMSAAFHDLHGKLSGLPRGKALAGVFEEELAKAWAQGMEPRGTPQAMLLDAAARANEDDYVRDDLGRFAEAGGAGKKEKPWHEGKHSRFTQSYLNGIPRHITAKDADTMLTEEIHVTDYDGNKTKFGRYLKNHLEEHVSGDSDGRKRKLLHAVDTVFTTPSKNDPVEPGRKVWSKNHGDFNMTVVADKFGNIQDVRTIIPGEGKKK
jgi:hypothetical protein